MNKKNSIGFEEIVPIVYKLLDSLQLSDIGLPRDIIPVLMRGVEYYGQNLVPVMANSILRFAQKNRHLPDHPLKCRTLREKLFWSKFFTPMPIPTPADKLAVAQFIPKAIRHKVRAPRIYWVSDKADDLLISRDLPAGGYFLKTNHGNRGMSRINIPIPLLMYEELRAKAKIWLARRNYGYNVGEWWYSTIKPRLFIEEEIIDRDGVSKQYKFLCINGQIFSIYRPVYMEMKAVEESIFDRDFSWIPGVWHLENPNPERPTPEDAQLMMEIATAIAAPFQFVRIDLYNPSPGVVYQGEITLCPDSGIGGYSPRSFDEALGANGDFTVNFR